MMMHGLANVKCSDLAFKLFFFIHFVINLNFCWPNDWFVVLTKWNIKYLKLNNWTQHTIKILLKQQHVELRLQFRRINFSVNKEENLEIFK